MQGTNGTLHYALDPSQATKADSPANHAYWLSGLSNRATSAIATVDAVSQAFGVGDPPVLPLALGAGTLDGGSHGPIPYQRRTFAWGPTPSQASTDRLDITARNLASATIDVARAHVDCNVDLHVTTDGPLTLELAGCARSLTLGGTGVYTASAGVGAQSTRACTSRRAFTIHVRRRFRARLRSARVLVGRRVVARMHPGADSAPVDLRGLPLGHVSVRIVMRLSSGRTVTDTRHYHLCTRRRHAAASQRRTRRRARRPAGR